MADQLEGFGVLGKPEDYGVTVKHVYPSFLVKDAISGKTRFVTAFCLHTTNCNYIMRGYLMQIIFVQVLDKDGFDESIFPTVAY